jgi:hypothetical protein
VLAKIQGMLLNSKRISRSFEEAFTVLFESDRSILNAREGSRAFGAMIQARIEDNWSEIASRLGHVSRPKPGRRTIYDFACTLDGNLYGFDVKTKDLDSARYSDGGVCAVANLLRFMANDNGIFMIVEFGHKIGKNSARSLEYIVVAPFHCLPFDEYRIENLGTGQVRLQSSLYDVKKSIKWDRSKHDFLEFFSGKAVAHYARVAADATHRISQIEAFRASNYSRFSATRRPVR